MVSNILLGIILAAGAATGVALTAALGSTSFKKEQSSGPASATFLGLAIGSLVAFLVATLTGQISALSRVDLPIVGIFALVGLLQNAVARRLWFVAVKNIGANQSNTLAATEGLYSMVLAVLFLGESVSLILALGAALILFAIFLTEASSSASLRAGSARLGYLTALLAAVCYGVRQVLVSYGLSIFPFFLFSLLIAYTTGLLFHVIIERPGRVVSQLRGTPRATFTAFTVMGVLTILTQMMSFSSLELAPVVFFAPLFSCYPIFTVLLTRIRASGYEVFGRRTFLSVSMVVVGAVLVSVASIL